MFLLLCTLIMWLMIFGLGLMYVGYLSPKLSNRILFQYTITLLWTSLLWISVSYFLSFKGGLQSIFFGEALTLREMLDMLCQLCFCLYAVGMMIGAIIDRASTKQLLLLSSIWQLFVYVPLAFLVWNKQGLLAQLGVVDFSGGLVVHLSASIASLVLAKQFGKTPHQHDNNHYLPLYLGTLFITFGWFGFNMAPVGDFEAKSVAILINTLLAIISGGFAWTLLALKHKESNLTPPLLNGMIVGLVTSTSAVGIANPLQMILVCTLASAMTYLLTHWINHTFIVDDVVDSFAMNGFGGLLGTLGVVIITPETYLAQTIGIITTIILSATVTFFTARLALRD